MKLIAVLRSDLFTSSLRDLKNATLCYGFCLILVFLFFFLKNFACRPKYAALCI